MAGKIYCYLAGDHERLDALLERAVSDREKLDASAYTQFRSGLLKHIAMEEKVLLLEAQRLRGGEALSIAPKLRLDHGALTALLVPSPTASIVAAIRAVLKFHNPIEEDPRRGVRPVRDAGGSRGGADIKRAQKLSGSESAAAR
jgi:hypothetical protein